MITPVPRVPYSSGGSCYPKFDNCCTNSLWRYQSPLSLLSTTCAPHYLRNWTLLVPTRWPSGKIRFRDHHSRSLVPWHLATRWPLVTIIMGQRSLIINQSPKLTISIESSVLRGSINAMQPMDNSQLDNVSLYLWQQSHCLPQVRIVLIACTLPLA